MSSFMVTLYSEISVISETHGDETCASCPGGAWPTAGRRRAGDDAEAEEFVEVLHLLVEILARPCGFVLGASGAVAQEVDGGLDLATFALLRDGDEDLPDILFRLESFGRPSW